MQQWIKNLFVFIPMFFNKQFASQESVFLATIAFFSFSFIASSIYCFNDIIDVEFDKKHNEKKNRPIASGLISIKAARFCMLGSALIGFALAYFCCGFSLFFVLLTYFSINIFYTLKLKQIIVLDVAIIALSFVMRLIAGGIATQTQLSYWILIMVFLLALYLAFAKRRDEVLIYIENKIIVRKNIDKYSIKFLDAILLILSLTLISLYLAYSFSPEIKIQFNSHYVWLTSIFVIFGLFRYHKLIKLRRNYVNPTKILLKDRPMQFILLGWLISFYIIIYV